MDQFITDKIEEIAFSTVTLDQELWESSVLDSITLIELIVEIELQYHIKVPLNEISVENFSSVSKMITYINSKK
jgi:acyl carrier protein